MAAKGAKGSKGAKAPKAAKGPKGAKSAKRSKSSNGLAGTTLRIDLTTGNIKRQPTDKKLMREWYGGRGVVAKILYDEVPRDATIRDHLGDVLARRGKLKEAIVEWQTSIKEWEAGSPVEKDAAEIAKINAKLEGARVRLAQEAPSASRKP